jgi:hypothetical protein
MLKDVQILKSKRVYVFLFLEYFEHMDPFLWNILKFTKKLKWFYEHLIRKSTFERKKPLVHMFFLSALNIQKDFWNMVNFHENFVIATWKVFKFICICSHGDSSKIQKIVLKDCPHTSWLLFSCFHPFANLLWLLVYSSFQLDDFYWWFHPRRPFMAH